MGLRKFIFSILLIGSSITLWSAETDFWVSAEYLNWRIKDQPLDTPLVTTASFADAIPGAIGQPHTKVLWGNKNIKLHRQQGFSLSAGLPLNCQLGMEGSYFLLPKTSQKMSLRTSGEPGSANFAVPIFDTTGFWGLNGIPGETVFILPGPLFGDSGFFAQFHLKVTSRFQGAELNSSIALLKNTPCFSLEGLGGFRWLQLEESLLFRAKTGTVPDFAFGPGHYNFKDSFKTANNFYGVQLGLRGQYDRNCWFGSVALKGGIGVINKRIHIHGKSDTMGGNLFYEVIGPTVNFDGGVFSQKSNQGVHEHSHFAGIFETSLFGGFNINSMIKLFVGYDFLWISNVSRPGKQLNRHINPTRTALADVSRDTAGISTGPIPFGESAGAELPQGKKEPRAYSKSSNFWAQGLTTGISVLF